MPRPRLNPAGPHSTIILWAPAMSHLDHIQPLDPDTHDAALTDCIHACWDGGVVDAGGIISIGIGLIAWGLSIYARDHGRVDIPGLRRAVTQSIDEVAVIDLRPEQAA